MLSTIYPPLPERISPADFVAPSDPSHLTKDDHLRAALTAIPLDPQAVLKAAQLRVASIEANATEALNESEHGQRLTVVKQRLATATAKLDQVTAEHQAAEQQHFTCLASADDAEVESSRNAVLALDARLGVMRREVETLAKLANEAERDRQAQRDRYIDTARRAVLDNSHAEAKAAFETLREIFHRPEVQQALMTLQVATMTVGVVHGDSLTRYRRNVNRFLSDGSYLP